MGVGQTQHESLETALVARDIAGLVLDEHDASAEETLAERAERGTVVGRLARQHAIDDARDIAKEDPLGLERDPMEDEVPGLLQRAERLLHAERLEESRREEGLELVLPPRVRVETAPPADRLQIASRKQSASTARERIEVLDHQHHLG